MAAAKRLNTNLVAFLTIMGMVLTVAVVLIVTIANTNRDPEVYAAKARQLEAAGDVERAVREYRRAFQVAHENKYVIESSRVLFEAGDYWTALGGLERANADAPQDKAVLEAMLGHLWTLHDFGRRDPVRMRDSAEKLIELDANNPLGPLSRAQALLELGEDPETVEQDIAAAEAIDAANPRLLLAKVDRLLSRDALAERAGVTTDRLARDDALRRETAAAALEDVLAMLDSGVAENPTDTRLVTRYAGLLLGADAEHTRAPRAREVLATAIEQSPEDAELHLMYGSILLQQVDDEGDALTAEERASIIDSAEQHLAESLKFEPATFRAYGELARAIALRGDPDTDPEAVQRDILERQIAVYRRAVDETSTLVSLRAMLGAPARAETLFRGFDRAMALSLLAADADEKQKALDDARYFLDASEVKYGELATTLLMRGLYAAATENEDEAIDSFMKIETRTGNQPDRRMLGMYAEATQRLAVLYQRKGQAGEAERYAEKALGAYSQLNQPPPVELIGLKLANQIGRGEAAPALDQIEALLRDAPDNERLLQLKAAALSALGRQSEATELLESTDGDDLRTSMMRAELAMADNDYATAENTLRQTLEQRPEEVRVLQLLFQVMARAERRAEFIEYVGELQKRVTDEHVRRQLDTFIVLADETDPAARDEKIIAIIMENPDKVERLSDLFNFHYTRRNLEPARRVLDELEADLSQGGPEVRRRFEHVLQQQFYLAIDVSDYARAEEYAGRLAELNVDRVNGARFRGALALAQRDGEKAVTELRTAERGLPPDAQIETLLAQAFLLCHPPRTTEALAAAEQAVAMKHDHPLANRILFLIKEQAGFEDEEERRTLLLRAYRLNRSDPTLRQKIELEAERLDPVRAVSGRERIREQDPNNLENLIRLGMLYATPQVNDPNRAETTLLAAVKLADTADLTDAATAAQVRRLYRAVARFYAGRGDRETGERVLNAYGERCGAADRVRVQLLLGAFYERLGEPDLASAAYAQAPVRASEIADEAVRREMRLEADTVYVDYLARAKRPDDVIEICRGALGRLDPDDTQKQRMLRMRIIDTLIGTLDIPEASREIDAYISDFPDDYLGLAARARQQLLSGQLDEARQTLTAALVLQPEQAWCLFTRGSINVDLRYMREAEEDLTTAKRVAPHDFNMQHRLKLAQLYIMTERARLAENEYLEILDDELTPSEIRQRVATDLVKLYRRGNRVDQAEEMISRYAAKQPDDAFWPYQLGLLRLEAHNYAGAQSPLRQAVELTKWENQAIVADWMRGLLFAERAQEVVDAADQMPPEKQTPLIRVVTAHAYYRLGRMEDAERKAREALANASQLGMDMLARIWRQTAQFYSFDEIIDLCQKLIDQGVGDVVVQTRLRTVQAELLVRTERPEESLDVLAVAKPATPEKSLERSLLLLIEAQAVSTLKGGFDDEVRALYEQVLAIDANNLTALNNLAFWLSQRGDAQAALTYVERLRLLRDENANTWDTIGVVYTACGKFAEARNAFNRALLLEEENLDAHLHMCELMLKENKTVDARRLAERALEIARAAGRTEEAERAQELLDGM